jgi:hypothetical protein
MKKTPKKLLLIISLVLFCSSVFSDSGPNVVVTEELLNNELNWLNVKIIKNANNNSVSIGLNMDNRKGLEAYTLKLFDSHYQSSIRLPIAISKSTIGFHANFTIPNDLAVITELHLTEQLRYGSGGGTYEIKLKDFVNQ